MLPTKAGGLVGRVTTAVVALAVLAMVVSHPADAAMCTVDAFHLASRVIGGVSNFLRDVLG